MALADGKSSPMVTTARLLDDLALWLSPTRSELDHHVTLLEEGRLAKGMRSVGGLVGVSATPRGKEQAASFGRDRDNRVLRLRQLQDDYLRWLYEKIELDGESPTAQDYLAEFPSYLGQVYETSELENAVSRLRAAGFIDGDPWEDAAHTRPELTDKARRAVESFRSVHEGPPVSGPQNINHTYVGGNSNVSVASSHVTQNLTVENGWSEQVAQFIDAVSQMMPLFSDDLKADLARQVENARDAVQQQEPKKARRALTAIGKFLGDTASGALGGVLAAQIPLLLQLLSG